MVGMAASTSNGSTAPSDSPVPASPVVPDWLKAAFRVPNRLYAAGAGWVLGHRFVQVTHVGRRSGKTYRVVLEVIRYDRTTGEAVVISGTGPRADWLLNFRHGSPAHLDFGHGPRPAAYAILSQSEAEATLHDYLRRNRLIGPALNPVMSGLLGWKFDGGADAVARACRQMPMVAFVPMGSAAARRA